MLFQDAKLLHRRFHNHSVVFHVSSCQTSKVHSRQNNEKSLSKKCNNLWKTALRANLRALLRYKSSTLDCWSLHVLWSVKENEEFLGKGFRANRQIEASARRESPWMPGEARWQSNCSDVRHRRVSPHCEPTNHIVAEELLSLVSIRLGFLFRLI